VRARRVLEGYLLVIGAPLLGADLVALRPVAEGHASIAAVRCSRTLGATAFGFGWDSTLFKRLRFMPDGV
jgi:hypothetical protein